MAGTLALTSAQAVPLQDATWNATPGTADYNTDANWSTGTVPSRTAFFGLSTASALTLSAAATLEGWTINPGASAYTFTNGSTLTFTGAGIAVNGGSASLINTMFVYFQNGSSAGSASLVNNNAMAFNDNSTAGRAAIVNNASSTGTLAFHGNSSAGSASIVNNGTINFGNTSTAATASILNTNNSSVRFLDGSSAGSASIVSSGTLAFDGSSSAGNATIASSNSMVFGGTSSGGRAAITNTSTFSSIDFSFSTGALGDSKLTVGSLAGDGTVYLGRNQLGIGSNNLSTGFAGVITGCGPTGQECFNRGATGGGLLKTGTGTLTLGGINSYTGSTTVDSGTLNVNGSIATSSLTIVNVSGTLGGSGTVGNTLINGGTLAPGNPTGTLTVAGLLAFTSASSYAVEVSPSSADRVNVTGAATLGGATVNASFAPGSYVAKQYTILNAAGGVSGTFGAQVNSNLPGNITSNLSYDANNAYLNLTLAFASSTLGNGLSSNQNVVGNALVGYFDRNGGIPLVFGALTPNGLTQAAGETAAGAQQPGFTAATQFMGTLSDPTAAGRGADAPGPMAYAEEGDALAYAAGRKRSGAERDAYALVTKAPPRAFLAHWSVWASGFGGTQTTDGNTAAGTSTSSSRIGGVAVGADYWLSAQTVAGFALAGGATSFSVAGGGGGQSDLFQVGGFVRHTVGSAYLTASAAYGWQQVTTDRTVGGDALRARFDTNSYSARLEAGNRYATPWLGLALTPYAAAQLTYLDLPSYAETASVGTGTFALAYAGKGIAATRSELGLRSDKSFAVNDAILTLRGRAAWAHDYNTERSASATFQSLPGASFIVNGARPASDAALTTASAEMAFSSGISLAATFDGEFSDVTRSYAGKGTVRYNW